MSLFELPITLINSILVSGKDISDLNFTVDQPPRIKVNGELLPADIKGLHYFTPYQTEILSMALIGGKTSVAKKLINAGSVETYFNLHQHYQYQVNISLRENYAIDMRARPASEARSLPTQSRAIYQDQVQDSDALWTGKSLLFCGASPSSWEIVNKALAATKMEMSAAQSAAQAIETICNFDINIVLLDPEFDSLNKGGHKVLRYLHSLMPKNRRHLYIGLVSRQLKTGDTYMAFLNGVDLTVNSEEFELLPAILAKSLKDYNELYLPFYEANNGR
jgi:hypothetical protein